MDKIDRAILELLQANGRLSNAEIAEHVSLSPPACWKRLKRLEEVVISGYHAHLDRNALGFGLFAFVSIILEGHSDEVMNNFEEEVKRIPNIISCHNISGRYDYLLQVVVKDMNAFHYLAMNQIRAIGNIKEMNTGFSLKEIKLSAHLPL
ncbi:Lrp/AsnC family transcriptional regulator [Serratia plymuthica]|uniref:Lrp/AsnC family transcriptional regulator n=1 Tax=Yersiniaceae TaxID=1903411 RepID=UPI002DB8426B|nr:Lrp/AsnC family transcriptional regulator [Serratia plymuthica]MEB6540944.1 Lrp/AsnC family transcriptional regulator [Serratia plymuthica]